MKKFETLVSTNAMDVLLLLVGNAMMNDKAQISLARDLVREIGWKSCSNVDVKGYLKELFALVTRFYMECNEDGKDTAQA